MKQAGQRRWMWPSVIVSSVLVLGMLWWQTPISQWAQPQNIAERIAILVESPWAPLLLALTYLTATMVMFPVFILNLSLILTLGPLWGVVFAWFGMVLSGAFAFGIGRRFGRKPLSGLDIAALDKALSVIRRSGLPGMILLRLVPVAPYPVVNLALGAGGVRTPIFLIGTLVGVLPSLIAVGVIGFQVLEVLQDPDGTDVGILIGMVLVIASLGWWVKRRLASQFEET